MATRCRVMPLAPIALMLSLQLTHDEAKFLSNQLARGLRALEDELVHTEAIPMQHELAVDLDRLRALYDRLQTLLRTDSGPVARERHAG